MTKQKYIPKHYVYIMKPSWRFKRQMSGWHYVKVGIANNPDRRKKEFQTAYPCDVIMLRVYEFALKKEAQIREKDIHRRYKKYQLKGGGREWFYVPDSVLLEIKLDLLTSDHSTRSPLWLFIARRFYTFFNAIEKRIAKWRGKVYEEGISDEDL